MKNLNQFQLFDSHFHIIDKRFPLVANQGYLPDGFTVTDYLDRTKSYNIAGGAIVSGSFQGFDQTYLLSVLAELGSGFVGVTQLPANVSDTELICLDQAGVRAVRFNLKRGGSEEVKNMERFAARIYATVGWHIELYVDAKDLPELHDTLIKLPCVCIDHLGLSKVGFLSLLSLVEKGVFVKASGFSRVDFEVKSALREIVVINPAALVFGTDLPSTRAPQPYSDNDYRLVIDALGETMAQKVFYENAINLYRPKKLFATRSRVTQE
ncbi:MAG: amidohydrolase family protein [Desulfuromonadales bacterium]|nr:amidohydrolase family protein [Desulfuromonadales bacterium]